MTDKELLMTYRKYSTRTLHWWYDYLYSPEDTTTFIPVLSGCPEVRIPILKEIEIIAQVLFEREVLGINK